MDFSNIDIKIMEGACPYVKYNRFETEEEWKQWRQQRIGASDIPIIMGQSSYKSEEELLEEKRTGKSRDSSYKEENLFREAKEAEHGILEDFVVYLREEGIQKILEEYLPIKDPFRIEIYKQVCLSSTLGEDDIDWASATLDALLCIILPPDDNVHYEDEEEDEEYDVSIRAIRQNIFFIPVETKYLGKLKEHSELMFISQIQWQKLLTTYSIKTCWPSCRQGILVKKNKHNEKIETHIINGLPDIGNKYKYNALAFLKKMREASTQETKKEKAQILPKTTDAELAYLEAKRELDRAEAKMEEAKELLLFGLDEKADYVGSRLHIKRSPIKGRVNYDAIEELAKINLNRFRSPITYRTVIKDKGE